MADKDRNPRGVALVLRGDYAGGAGSKKKEKVGLVLPGGKPGSLV